MLAPTIKRLLAVALIIVLLATATLSTTPAALAANKPVNTLNLPDELFVWTVQPYFFDQGDSLGGYPNGVGEATLMEWTHSEYDWFFDHSELTAKWLDPIYQQTTRISLYNEPLNQYFNEVYQDVKVTNVPDVILIYNNSSQAWEPDENLQIKGKRVLYGCVINPRGDENLPGWIQMMEDIMDIVVTKVWNPRIFDGTHMYEVNLDDPAEVAIRLDAYEKYFGPIPYDQWCWIDQFRLSNAWAEILRPKYGTPPARPADTPCTNEYCAGSDHNYNRMGRSRKDHLIELLKIFPRSLERDYWGNIKHWLVPILMWQLGVSSDADLPWLDEPQPPVDPPFIAKASDWAKEAIQYALDEGWITPGSAEFAKLGPKSEISRANTALIIFRALGVEADNRQAFNDLASCTPSQIEAIESLSSEVLKGTGGGKFSPNPGLTRQELVTVVVRAYEFYKGGVLNPTPHIWADQNKIAGWAIDEGALNKAYNAGWVGGIGGNRFDPLSKIQIEGLITILYRILNVPT